MGRIHACGIRILQGKMQPPNMHYTVGDINGLKYLLHFRALTLRIKDGIDRLGQGQVHKH